MSKSNDITFDRRRFLSGATAMGAASILGWPEKSHAEPPPEIKKIRLVKIPAICIAPEYLAEELLRLEGFTEIEYVEIDRPATQDMLIADRADIGVASSPEALPGLDGGRQSVILSGLHGGCYELFANPSIQAVRDLKGKRIAVSSIPGTEYYYISTILAYVGIDPVKHVQWINLKSTRDTVQYFIDGKVDAFLAFPPDPQKMRELKFSNVLVNTAQDRPWNGYYCCMVAARSQFIAKYPIATKRALRAILKATDICATDPERVARHIVARGYEARYDIALEVIKSLSYNTWRTYDPEDSLRFFGVRLHEVGLIKTHPNKLIAKGTDWRFLNELKKELKA
jgi:NitT/TauT family transport system substrate-binding protein